MPIFVALLKINNRMKTVAKILFALAWIVVALMCCDFWIWNDGSVDALVRSAERLPYLGWSAVALASVSGVLAGIHKVRERA